MTASERHQVASDRRSGLFLRSRKERPITEYVGEWVFRPLAHVVVLALLPLRVPPPAVVLGATAVGAAAAFSTFRGHLFVAALLLQLKTVLDNADGQLARASGRVSVFGRYLDSESDLLVNALLFAALGDATGRPILAAVGFLALTLVLGVDFNLERLYRREYGDERDPMPHAEGRTRVLERIYAVVYAPQDRWVERFVEWRLQRLQADTNERLAYHDRTTIAIVANFGLSTQLAAIGICLALGAPTAALLLPIGCSVALIPLALRREHLAQRTRRATTTRG